MSWGRKKPTPDTTRPEFITDPETGAGLRGTAPWTAIESRPGSLIVAFNGWAPDTAVDVRPNAVLTWRPATPPVEDLLTLACTTLADIRAGFHTAAGDAVGVHVVQWYFVRAEWASTLTATCGVDSFRLLDPYFEHLASTVRLPGSEDHR